MNKNSIRLITFFSALLCLLWLFGLGWTITKYYASTPGKVSQVKTASKKAENKKTINIVALGDSLTKGLGDDTGKGFVGDIKDQVKKRTNKQVSLLNLGINGQTSDELCKQVKQPEVLRQIGGADMVLITIGGNDLFRGGQGLVDYKTDKIMVIEKKYLDNLKFIFTEIRNVNPNANVFFVGLYNPFINLSTGKETSTIVRRWNYDSAEVSAAFPKVVFVPTFDLFELKVNDYLYSDKFHPNSKGYRLIAERVAALLTW
ncbi:SGNH/GDSL hydrolase family protein [Bacillus sp. EB600]|uniref:SGNH/GDSL hydrolase family protein n=1 Tax=Bacillus sp. EB600 TaxID=2806345 RepID=UPI0021094D5E|nr:SGNH/GDSL hydrolase family protein [Bacillus sp. EB600]MCQ6279160.1 SGNH/GDSL hydrolase family protein [Bacillus sp. EB600]